VKINSYYAVSAPLVHDKQNDLVKPSLLVRGIKSALAIMFQGETSSIDKLPVYGFAHP
jgi:hypothetical protein